MESKDSDDLLFDRPARYLVFSLVLTDMRGVFFFFYLPRTQILPSHVYSF